MRKVRRSCSLFVASDFAVAYAPAVYPVKLYRVAASALKAEYQKTARDLYSNTVTWEEAKLPRKVSGLLREDFVAASSLGETRYGRILQDGQAYRWRSSTPLRMYSGVADEVVPPVYRDPSGGLLKSDGRRGHRRPVCWRQGEPSGNFSPCHHGGEEVV